MLYYSSVCYLSEVPVGELYVPVEHQSYLLVGHVQPHLHFGRFQRVVVGRVRCNRQLGV